MMNFRPGYPVLCSSLDGPLDSVNILLEKGRDSRVLDPCCRMDLSLTAGVGRWAGDPPLERAQRL
ncbi:uncharacterized protein BDW43DRAFT_263257 [Aspergillus alliaceus]|uniref:uncharacterized protein n=1 Tax=Petromyces alliaceus TaxID=209559 RepID=UPI0012A3B505|nr:uncharacterized protein BDW43DRAFT_263257 [Aspergillus alliaceus]KAB8238204.1 hypothetical protein BDW43DRAFT_263257 [Aspergillus alliaceus]